MSSFGSVRELAGEQIETLSFPAYSIKLSWVLKSSRVKMESAAMLFDQSAHYVDEVYSYRWMVLDGAVKHATDDETGTEEIQINFPSLTPAIKTIFIAVFSSGESFNSVDTVECRISPIGGEGFSGSTFRVTALGGGANMYSCTMVAFQKTEGSGEWKMQAIGHNCKVQTIFDMREHLIGLIGKLQWAPFGSSRRFSVGSDCDTRDTLNDEISFEDILVSHRGSPPQKGELIAPNAGAGGAAGGAKGLQTIPDEELDSTDFSLREKGSAEKKILSDSLSGSNPSSPYHQRRLLDSGFSAPVFSPTSPGEVVKRQFSDDLHAVHSVSPAFIRSPTVTAAEQDEVSAIAASPSAAERKIAEPVSPAVSPVAAAAAPVSPSSSSPTNSNKSPVVHQRMISEVDTELGSHSRPPRIDSSQPLYSPTYQPSPSILRSPAVAAAEASLRGVSFADENIRSPSGPLSQTKERQIAELNSPAQQPSPSFLRSPAVTPATALVAPTAVSPSNNNNNKESEQRNQTPSPSAFPAPSAADFASRKPRPRRQSFALERGEAYIMEKGLTHLAMGLGWQVADDVPSIDLDAGVVVFNKQKEHSEDIYFNRKKSSDGAIVHGGDNIVGGTGEKDDELIILNLSELNDDAAYIFFTVCVFSTGLGFSSVAKAYCRLINLEDGNHELCRFDLDKSKFGNAVVMACLSRSESTGNWEVHAMGVAASGRTVREVRSELLRVLQSNALEKMAKQRHRRRASMLPAPLVAPTISEVVSAPDEEDAPPPASPVAAAPVAPVVSPSSESVGDLRAVMEAGDENVVEAFPSYRPRPRSKSFSLEQGERYILDPTLTSLKMGLGWKKLETTVDLDAGVIVFNKDNEHIEDVYFSRKVGQNGGLELLGDSLVGGEGKEDDEEVNVDLTKLSPEVQTLVFSVCIYSDGLNFSKVDNAFCRLANRTDSNHELCRFTLNEKKESNAIIMCALTRRGQLWELLPLGLETQGRTVRQLRPIVTEHLTTGKYEQIKEARRRRRSSIAPIQNRAPPALAAVQEGEIEENFPSHRPRPRSRSFMLERGERYLLEDGVINLSMGLGWEVVENAVDLDAGVALFDHEFHHIEDIYFSRQVGHNGAISHHGDHLTGGGGGDDERISVRLDRMEERVKALFFTVCIFTKNKTFAEVGNAYCRLVDEDSAVKHELCRFPLTEKIQGSSVLMACLLRSGDGWELRALGLTLEGHTVREMRSPLQQILKSGRLEQEVQERRRRRSSVAPIRKPAAPLGGLSALAEVDEEHLQSLRSERQRLETIQKEQEVELERLEQQRLLQLRKAEEERQLEVERRRIAEEEEKVRRAEEEQKRVFEETRRIAAEAERRRQAEEEQRRLEELHRAESERQLAAESERRLAALQTRLKSRLAEQEQASSSLIQSATVARQLYGDLMKAIDDTELAAADALLAEQTKFQTTISAKKMEQAARQTLEDRVQELEQQLQQAQAERSQLARDFAAEKQQLQASVSQLEMKLTLLSADSSRDAEEASHAKRELETLRSQWKEERMSLVERLKLFETKVETTSAQQERESQRVKELVAEEAALREELRTVQENLVATKKSLIKANHELTGMKEQHEEERLASEKRLAALERDLKIARAGVERGGSELEATQQAYDELRLRFTDAVASLRKVGELERTAREMQLEHADKVNRLQAEIEQADLSRDQLSRALDQRISQLRILQAQLEDEKANRERLDDRLSAANRRVRDLEETMEIKRAAIRDLEASEATARRQATSAEAELRKLRTQMMEVEAEGRASILEVGNLQEAIKAKQIRLCAVEDQLRAAETRVIQLQEEADTLHSSLATMEIRASRAESNRKASEERVSHLRGQLLDIQAEMEVLRQGHLNLSKHMASPIGKDTSAATIRELQRSVEELAIQLRSAHELCENQEQERLRLLHQITRTEQQVTTRVATLERQLRSVAEERDRLAEELGQEKRRAEESYRVASADREKSRDLERKLAGVEAQVSADEISAKEATRAYKELQSALERSLHDRASMETELGLCKQRLREMETAVAAAAVNAATGALFGVAAVASSIVPSAGSPRSPSSPGRGSKINNTSAGSSVLYRRDKRNDDEDLSPSLRNLPGRSISAMDRTLLSARLELEASMIGIDESVLSAAMGDLYSPAANRTPFHPNSSSYTNNSPYVHSSIKKPPSSVGGSSTKLAVSPPFGPISHHLEDVASELGALSVSSYGSRFMDTTITSPIAKIPDYRTLNYVTSTSAAAGGGGATPANEATATTTTTSAPQPSTADQQPSDASLFVSHNPRPRTQSFALEQGETYVLDASLNEVTMGIGWKFRKDSADLDAGCVLFDSENRHLEDVYFSRQQGQQGAILHSGDSLRGLGNKDVETISVSLNKLDARVQTLFFAVCVYSPDVKFSQIGESFCRLIATDSNFELCRYTLNEGFEQSAIVMCALTRRNNGWQLIPLGLGAKGRSVRELRGELSTMLQDDVIERARTERLRLKEAVLRKRATTEMEPLNEETTFDSDASLSNRGSSRNIFPSTSPLVPPPATTSTTTTATTSLGGRHVSLADPNGHLGSVRE